MTNTKNNEPIYINCEQRSEEWYKLRAGVITASACEKIMGYQRKDFVYGLLAEKLTGKADSFEPNEYMLWGIETEDQARKAYEAVTGNEVKEVGFVYRNSDKRVGCSPDGLVGEDGLIEIKCPMTKTHLKYLDSGAPKNYIAQMNFQMYVTGRKWCDFVTFDPRVKEDRLKIKIERYELDVGAICEIDDAVKKTISDLDTFLKAHEVE